MNDSTVNVLTPHGRRLNVKVQPNKTLMQILEEVCTKYQFNSQEYDLIHHRRVLDLSQMFRFSGLPNNAQLEMVEATKKRTEQEVIIMLQLEDGSRKSGQFLPSKNFQEILQELCPEQLESSPSTSNDSSKTLVLIYMRTELFGDALVETTLKQLGLTGGRAMLRLIHRNPESLKTQANVSSILQAKPVVASQPAPLPLPVPINEKTATKEMETSSTVDEASSSSIKPIGQSNMEIDQFDRNLNSPVDRKKIKIVDDHPSTSKQSISNDSLPEPIKMEQETEDKPEEPVYILGDNNAVIFSLDSINKNGQKGFDDLPDSFFLLNVDDAKIILRDIRAEQQGTEDAPLLTAKLREMQDSCRTLMKLNRYKKTIIRIQFPERLVLQGIFSPIDTIESVCEFIRPYLKQTDLEFYLFTTPPKTHLPNEARLVELDCVPAALLHFGVADLANNGKFLKDELLTKLSSPSAAILEASKSRKLIIDERQPGEDDGASGSDNNNLLGGDGSTSNQADLINQAQRQRIADKFKMSSMLTGASGGGGGTGGTSGTADKVPKWFKPSK